MLVHLCRDMLFAVAALKNAFDDTAELCVADRDDIPDREPGLLERAKGYMPSILVRESNVLIIDRQAIQVRLKTCVGIDRENPRVVRIPNSLHVEHIMLSEAYYSKPAARSDPEIEREPEALIFDESGNLTNLVDWD